MTENESRLTKRNPDGSVGINDFRYYNYTDFQKLANKLAEFEDIGTVEELQEAKMQYDNIHSIAEKTALMGLSDYGTAKEALITEMKRSLDYSLKEYQSIGTIEEFKALKEKSVPKKVVVEHIPKTSWTKEVSHYLCPSCRSIFSFGGNPYCSNCGQKIDWK